jgi:16S rRNA G966 N2-methylase RsmD
MLRIIAGEFRRRKLRSPPEGATTRPIPDRVKESVFSMLRGNCEGAAVLDCFAGTGAIGLEAVSRGAARCVLVEQDRRVCRVLEENIRELGCEDRCEVVQGDALGTPALSRCPKPVDLIFFDPPYALMRDPGEGGGWERVRRQLIRLLPNLSDTGYLVLRTPWPFTHGGEIIEGDDDAADVFVGKGRGPAKPGGREHLKFTSSTRHGRDKDGFADLDDDEPVEMEMDENGNWVVPGEERLRRLGRLAPPIASIPPIPDGLDDGPPVERAAIVEVSLELEGAIGPETHDYGKTAVHLYMRKR